MHEDKLTNLPPIILAFHHHHHQYSLIGEYTNIPLLTKTQQWTRQYRKPALGMRLLTVKLVYSYPWDDMMLQAVEYQQHTIDN